MVYLEFFIVFYLVLGLIIILIIIKQNKINIHINSKMILIARYRCIQYRNINIDYLCYPIN